MILDRLILQNFKRFRDVDIDFKNGITGIIGSNGVGKSSIVDAVFFALYGVSGGLTSDFIVSSFSDEQCTVYLHFHIGSDRYFIRRTFKKGKTVQHDAQLNCNQETRATGVTQVEAEIRKILGMGPADFRSTIYAAQKDLMTLLDLTPGKRKEWFLRALGIDYLNTGSQKILKEQADAKEKEATLLLGELAALTRQDPAELEQTRADLIALASKIRDLEALDHVLQRERETKSAEKQTYDLQTVRQGKLIDQEKVLRNDIAEMTARVATLKEQESSFAVNDQEIRQLDQMVVTELPQARLDIEGYRTKKARLEQIEVEKKSALREQENIQARIAKIDAKLQECIAGENELIGLSAKVRTTLGCDADKNVDEAVSEQQTYVSEKSARLNARLQTIDGEITRLRKNLNTLLESGSDGTCPICNQKLGDHFDSVKNDYLERIGEFGIEGDDLKKELNETRELSQRTITLKPTLDRIRDIRILLGYRETHLNDLAGLQRELLDTVTRVKALITESESIAYLPEDHDSCKQRLVELEAAQNRLNEINKQIAQQAGLRAQIAELNSQVVSKSVTLAEVKESIDKDPIDPTIGPQLTHEIEKLDLSLKNVTQDLAASTERERTLTQKIADLEIAAARIGTVQQQVTELRNEIEILKLTRAAIADYVVYIMQVVRSRIESEVSSIISEITGGKYDRVLIDEDFNLLVRENDREYTVDRFSGGEQDDIAVALRIALSRYLAELHNVHESTLLIFDEIFGSQDEERRANLLTALRSQESRFPQIILISHIAEIQGEFENTLLVQGNGPISTVQAGV